MKIESMDASMKRAVNATALDFKNDAASKQQAAAGSSDDEQERVSKAFIDKAVNKANRAIRVHNRSLEFKIHERTNEVMVKIIDTSTKEVIREIPPEKLLDMFANMLEMAGLLVDERG